MSNISLKARKLNCPGDINRYLQRTVDPYSGVSEKVGMILSGVKQDGDRALLEYIKEYDGLDAADISDICVGSKEISSAKQRVEKNLPELVNALAASLKNIEKYHRNQLEMGQRSWMADSGPGKKFGQKVTPIKRAGLYIPGGRYVYPSTVLMTAVPAIIAGVEEIMICSPPGSNGKLNDILLYLCSVLNISEVYRVGGAQAVAAMAYGTGTIKKVDKIVGPGNIFVTLAKKMVYGIAGIDSLAGPSDIAIIAGDGARPYFIALDLVSQAEHDPLSRSILLASSRKKAQEVICSIDEYMEEFGAGSRQKSNFDTAARSLKDNCRIFYSGDIDLLIEAVNIIAPEHLEIMAADHEYILKGIRNAGAIFIGDYTPVAVGDYIGGTNHVIPTDGNARFSSPLGVSDFLKRSSICIYNKDALEKEKKHIAEIAGFEKLYAHRDSVLKRF
ncbi:MAG TPA: histidinol dehydrogenase [Actinobacteria bacterium]|nr:histidinol dehydrogenase [Actinomycetota bacterium]